MSYEKSVMRFAHSNGHTHCCYTDDGECIITSGSEGDIRIWKGIHDDDPTSHCVGEFVLAILHYGQRMLASTDLNTVQAYTFPDGDRDGTEFRFTAPVTCMVVDQKYLAAGSEDTVIKVVLLDKSEEPFEFTGHTGPILKIDISVKGLLASSSGDGTVRIWSLSDKKELRCLEGFEKTKSFYAAKCFVSPSFEPVNGNALAYILNNEIVLVNTDTWDTKATLKNTKITSDYTVCRYSRCGRYIAAGTASGDICIWDIRSGNFLAVDGKGNDAQGITAIDWNPVVVGELAYTDNTGQLGTVTECISAEREQQIGDDPVDEDEDVVFDGIEFADNEEDADNENCVSLERLKNETMKQNDEEIDDLLDAKTTRSESVVDEPMSRQKSVPLQAPFQPSSTPQHLEHRYLLWNDVGIVRAHETDAENSIEVEFHDASVHHGIHMTNYLHHKMASLSTTVLALACETPSKLVCIALGAASREWSISLPDCEDVVALGATEKLVAVATDARYLRIFSVMGTQREMLCLPGPAIAIAGHKDMLCVVYHSGAASDGAQNLSAMLVQAIGLSLRVTDVQMPLTPGTKLTWIGFSDNGSPVCADALGMVRLYSTKSNYWMPICDMSLHRKNTSDTFFPLAVSENGQIVRAILCRGASYPMITPKPMVSELTMQMPLCDLESEKAQLEESLLRYVNMQAENSERQMKAMAMKLFALACRSEMEARAKELIEMIASPQLLPLAIKYAQQLGRIHMAEKLSDLMPKFEEQEKEREKHFNSVALEAVHLIQNSPMGATMLLGNRDKNTTPLVTPRPLAISQTKRNPFKRGGLASAAKSVVNPLSHLTDKAIGFNDSQSSLYGVSPLASETTDAPSPTPLGSAVEAVEHIENSSENIENKADNENKPPLTFMSWFTEHKEGLQREFPDANMSELTKIGMRQYKSIMANAGSVSTNVNHKRKMTEDEELVASGVAKLAKFASRQH